MHTPPFPAKYNSTKSDTTFIQHFSSPSSSSLHPLDSLFPLVPKTLHYLLLERIRLASATLPQDLFLFKQRFASTSCWQRKLFPLHHSLFKEMLLCCTPHSGFSLAFTSQSTRPRHTCYLKPTWDVPWRGVSCPQHSRNNSQKTPKR